MFLVPILMVVLLTKFNGWAPFELLAAGIFGIASLTDWADGYLARRRNQVTGLGQWMDPLADKLLVIAALVSLVQMERAQGWMVAIILGREFMVTVLRTMAHAKGQTLPASPIGKVKMVAQVVAILVLILGQRHMHELYVVGTIALWVATIAALISAADYSRRLNSIVYGRPVPPAASPEAPPKRVSA